MTWVHIGIPIGYMREDGGYAGDLKTAKEISAFLRTTLNLTRYDITINQGFKDLDIPCGDRREATKLLREIGRVLRESGHNPRNFNILVEEA